MWEIYAREKLFSKIYKVISTASIVCHGIVLYHIYVENFLFILPFALLIFLIFRESIFTSVGVIMIHFPFSIFMIANYYYELTDYSVYKQILFLGSSLVSLMSAYIVLNIFLDFDSLIELAFKTSRRRKLDKVKKKELDKWSNLSHEEQNEIKAKRIKEENERKLRRLNYLEKRRKEQIIHDRSIQIKANKSQSNNGEELNIQSEIQTSTETKTITTANRTKTISISKSILILFVIMSLITCASRKRIGAKCYDGTNSYSTSSGTCSHHGGVKNWKYEYWWD